MASDVTPTPPNSDMPWKEDVTNLNLFAKLNTVHPDGRQPQDPAGRYAVALRASLDPDARSGRAHKPREQAKTRLTTPFDKVDSFRDDLLKSHPS